MKKEDIINAYCRIRTVDHTIPDDVLDFMKDSAIKELEKSNEEIEEAAEYINDLKMRIYELETTVEYYKEEYRKSI